MVSVVAKTKTANTETGWSANRVYLAAAVCLFAGLLVGYFLVGSHAGQPSSPHTSATAGAATAATYAGGHPKLTLEQMKQMADIQASSLIEKSKAEPKNSALLLQIAGIYQASHQFKDAAIYLEKALMIDPKNVPARTELASCLYYSDDVDGSLAQLNQALKYNPKDTNALFNLGMIKYRGKKDAAGAVAAWQQLLKASPNLDRKPIVEQLIAEAKASTAAPN
jgi:cytochrome c-type biogenesis protein CcmH/NrfG